MNQSTAQKDSYAAQIEYLTKLLTSTEEGIIPQSIADGGAAFQMRLFAEENIEKRRDKLSKQLSFLEDCFDDLDALFAAYCRTEPQQAYATVISDGEHFLQWLRKNHHLTPEQKDFVTCEQARLAVESLARERRQDHLRFQELWSVAATLAESLAEEKDLTILMNPLRHWSQFLTNALVEEEDELPADVLFFAVGEDIRTAVFDAPSRALIAELAARAPCTLAPWAACSELADREELIDFCKDLAEMGLIAFS